MKTLLITTLTTALLSFNSFAYNTTDIKSMASQMAKEGQHQLNTQFTVNLKVKVPQYLKAPALTINNTSQASMKETINTNSIQAKNSIQATD